jgi:4-hydroxy-tetrahydrodipicolinate synthase
MTLAEKVELPIVLYNVPGRTSVNLLPATVARLRTASDRFIAVKEAGGNLDAVSEIRLLCDITIISGDDSLTLPMMSIGAQGVISVLSNVLPAEVKQLTQLALRGDFAGAGRVHHRLFALSKSLFADGSPSGVKCAMRLLDRDTGELRLPLVEVNARARAAIEQQLRKLDLSGRVTL